MDTTRLKNLWTSKNEENQNLLLVLLEGDEIPIDSKLEVFKTIYDNKSISSTFSLRSKAFGIMAPYAGDLFPDRRIIKIVNNESDK